ncbi:MAG: carbamoyltransferase [Chlamydiae bacterium]|nr:carbamoyltransferase [Chlamydiota bacterium]MBI3276189.1 carbamoyltransferase [Chlamydiota bacterium]
MNILGISAYYHDSAACFLRDGQIVAAAQEERFTRKRHDAVFPTHAVRYCLKEAGISVDPLDYVAFYDKPFIKFNRILETHLAFVPKGLPSFIKAIPLWLKQKLWIPDLIEKEIAYKGKVLFPEHHESHAASAYFPSPFKRAAFLTMDGVGEWATSSFGVGADNKIKIISELHFPHSLGLLYSAFTYFTGFKVNSGEYKVMGLAPYGEPKYVQKIYDHLIDLKEDGSFKMNMKYFNYCAGLTMTNGGFEELFDGPARKSESRLTQREMDLARSIQEVTEEIMLRMARHVKKVTGEKYLCLAGGVSLNCVGNGKILKNRIFDELWIQPAAGDAGGALGAAYIAYYHYLNKSLVQKNGRDLQKGSYLGPSYTSEDVKTFLDQHQIPYHFYEVKDLLDQVSDDLAQGKVIGWFQGRMEFGPRSLGARSILGDARSSDMQKRMNLKIKMRESFRPFAPSVLFEKVNEWFELEGESPYMLLVADVKKEKQRQMTQEEEKRWGIDKLNVIRSEIPAVTHVDYSARVQTVHKEDHPRYHGLLSQFYKKTGCPVLINTSFNVRGEPIVESPLDAYRCFMRTEMDTLVLENFIVRKEDHPPFHEDIDWKKVYELD